MTFINPTTSSIAAATAVQSTTATQGAASGQASTNPLQSLTDPNTFLNLLVAQLKYQDPLNPTSGTQFLSQTAQLTEVETLTNLATQVSNELSAQQTQTSTGLSGQQIRAKLADGTTVTGKVEGVTLDPTKGPTLTVNGTAVPLSAVETVGTTTGTTTGTTGTTA
jgi:flagellar basal-body rod modification protein FlgD